MQAHYADQVSNSLFAEEQARIRRERSAAEQRIDSLNVEYDQVQQTLNLALAMIDDIRRAYAQAGTQDGDCSTRGSLSALKSTARKSSPTGSPSRLPNSSILVATGMAQALKPASSQNLRPHF